MKQLIYIAFAAACFSMAGCSNDEPSMPVTTENDFESADGQLVVQLGALNIPQAAITRTPIDGTEISKLTNLGIFAVGRDVSLSQTDLTNWYLDDYSPRNILLGNAKAQGTSQYAYDSSVHQELRRITFFEKDAGIDVWKETTGAVYYYPMKIDRNYDFFGYFPRQNTEDIKVTRDAINVPFTITGDEDIIAGRAEKAKDINENTLYVKEDGTKGSDKVLQGYNAKYIREIKYNNWLIDKYPGVCNNGNKQTYVPNIKFNHLLTKLNFQVITAKEQAGDPVGGTEPGSDRVAAKNLRVSDITLLEAANKPTLNILTQELTWEASTEDLPMIKRQESTDWWEDTKIKPQEYNDSNSSYISAGYLMVKPSDSYNITLKVHAPSSSGIPQSQLVTLELKKADSTPFEAGHSYNIQIALFALQEVYASAELTKWVEEEPIYTPVE